MRVTQTVSPCARLIVSSATAAVVAAHTQGGAVAGVEGGLLTPPRLCFQGLGAG